MSGTRWIRTGAIVGAIGVLLGAFGAHGLAPTPEAVRAMESDPTTRDATLRRLANFETGVRYQMFHALAIVAVGIVAGRARPNRALNAAGILFLVGVIGFSGALCGLGVGGPRWLGMVAPIGGVAMILGWLAFAFGKYAD